MYEERKVLTKNDIIPNEAKEYECIGIHHDTLFLHEYFGMAFRATA
jgi:hypothetical protein